VLLDVIETRSAVAQPAALQRLQQLSADQRAALATEAGNLLDELLDECLPILEAQLRERLERRLQSLLDG
jgi:septum formation topological specificity factor MinE